MFVPFESLPADARIWIFQAVRPFSEEERATVERHLRAFTDEWSVHGMPLATSFTIGFNQFIVLGADETEQTASGCSIDSSVRAVKELEQMLGINLFDRNLVAFKTEEGVMLLPTQKLKENFSSGILNADTLTFNNLVATKAAFDQRWITPVASTWLTRYLTGPVAKVH